jgi:hypothetical protein
VLHYGAQIVQVLIDRHMLLPAAHGMAK